ncbi:MAG: biotin--[acetyl-CoA-carboxylase] ligase [Prevotella sp.]
MKNSKFAKLHMDDIKIIDIRETSSTNIFLKDYTGEEGRLFTIVCAYKQTAGHGQGGSCWESEPGKNLTFSIKFYPKNILASRQFILLEAGALAVKDCLEGFTENLSIKWPNDIYWRDNKISGTLSECSIIGKYIDYCIFGIGINVNQTCFLSDAPNPISLAQILGHDIDKKEVLDSFIIHLQKYIDMVNNGCHDHIDRLYHEAQYRNKGHNHTFQDASGVFTADIDHIMQNGHLVLRRNDGTVKSYAFKEVKYII